MACNWSETHKGRIFEATALFAVGGLGTPVRSEIGPYQAVRRGNWAGTRVLGRSQYPNGSETVTAEPNSIAPDLWLYQPLGRSPHSVFLNPNFPPEPLPERLYSAKISQAL
jgi:hypothetical protein